MQHGQPNSSMQLGPGGCKRCFWTARDFQNNQWVSLSKTMMLVKVMLWFSMQSHDKIMRNLQQR